MPNQIVLDAGTCSGCGACIRTCPECVFEAGPAPRTVVVVARPDRCLGCLACEEDCPEGALTVHRLPMDMDMAEVPEPGLGLDLDRTYDMVVVGAGPAGLGAAIEGRRLGLSVAVLERLPSPRRSHHPDGGILQGAGDVMHFEETPAGLHLREVDVTIPADRICERLNRMLLMGPDGTTTRSPRPGPSMIAVPKDRFVELLADRARDAGATVAWNTRVAAIERDPGDGPVRVRIDGGHLVRGRVAVSAEGSTGRLAVGCGIPVNEFPVGWSYGAMMERGPIASPRDEMGFALGGPEGLPKGVGVLSYWSSGTGRTEFMSGTVQKGRSRLLPGPVSDFVRDLSGTPRFAGRIGRWDGLAQEPDGCRIFARRLPRTAVGDRVIAVGDALTTCGMLTSVAALRTGAMAAGVAAAALSKGDVSGAGLAAFDRQVFRMSMVQGMAWMHGVLIEAPLELSLQDQAALFGMLRHLDLGRLMGGGPGAVLALLGFSARAGGSLWRRKDLRRYLMPAKR